jgi:predicted HD superfamily hydrolase involved in NAD metabolism
MKLPASHSPLHAALEERVAALPQGLREHIERVRALANQLAVRFNVDAEAVDLAVLLHDLARAENDAELLSWAQETGYPLLDVEQAFPLFLHGPKAAHLAQRRLGISDPAVLQAAAFHTTGCIDMSPVAQVVYLADKLEPGKTYRSPDLETVRRWAERDLERAVLELLTWQLRFHLDRGDLLHPNTIAARNQLLLRSMGRHR